MAAHGTEWSDARTEQFRALLADLSIPYSEIGRRLGGLSVSAVSGKRKRLGLPERGSPIHPGGFKRKPRHVPRSVPLPVVRESTLPKLRSDPQSPPSAAPTAPPATPQLPRGTCQFIAGDVWRKGWSFCGALSWKPGSPWCAKHKRLVFVKRPTMQRDGEEGDG